MRRFARPWSSVAFMLAIFSLAVASARSRALLETNERSAAPSVTGSEQLAARALISLVARASTTATNTTGNAAKNGNDSSINTALVQPLTTVAGNATSTSSADSVTSPSTSTAVVTVPAPTAGGGVVTQTQVTVVYPAKRPISSPLSTPIIIVIAACGGLAVVLIVLGCCIARRRRGKKNDWLATLLASEDDEASSPRSSSGPSKDVIDDASASTPPKTMPQPAVSHLPMMSLPPFFPMFGGMPPPQPQPAPYMSQTPAPVSVRHPSLVGSRSQAITMFSRSHQHFATPRSPEIPHHPGLPSVEPNVYDDGSLSTAVSQNEKNRWLRKARQGLTASQAPDLLPPDRPPSPDHSCWDGGSGPGSDNLTSISRRHLKRIKKEAAKRSVLMPAPMSGTSSAQRGRPRDKISLSDSDLQMSRAASTRQTGSLGDMAGSDGRRPQPATAFSLSNSDLQPSSSYRGASNNSAPKSTLPGNSMSSGAGVRPRHRRIDSLIRSDVVSKRSR